MERTLGGAASATPERITASSQYSHWGFTYVLNHFVSCSYSNHNCWFRDSQASQPEAQAGGSSLLPLISREFEIL